MVSRVNRVMGSLRWAGEGRGNSKKREEKGKKEQPGTESWLDAEKKVER